MFKIGDRVKATFKSPRHADGLVNGKRLVKYVIGTLNLKTNEDGTQELALDNVNTKNKIEQMDMDQFIAIRKI